MGTERYHPACSIVHQPTTVARAPILLVKRKRALLIEANFLHLLSRTLLIIFLYCGTNLSSSAVLVIYLVKRI
jgi:hypothetical protein